MDYQSARNLAADQHPVRRSSWPTDHHVRHHVEESGQKLKLHTPDKSSAEEWQPNFEDQAATDWEQYTPQPHSEGQ